MASKASTQHINLKLSEIPIQLTILTVKHQRYISGLQIGFSFSQEGNSNAAIMQHQPKKKKAHP